MKLRRVLLSRYLAEWADGVERVIHAHSWEDARDLALRLSTVRLERLTALDSQASATKGAA